MNKHNIIDELSTLTTCQSVLAELLGEVPEGMCSTKNLAILVGYLQTQQERLGSQFADC